MVTALGKKSYLGQAEISSIVYLVLLKEREGNRVSCIYCFS